MSPRGEDDPGSSRTPYEVLGVPRDATGEQIKRAYREKAKAHHPDVNKAAGAASEFALVKQAYDLLRDPQRRRAFDQPPTAPGSARVGTGHYHWSNIAARPSPKRGRGAGAKRAAAAHDLTGFDELYESFFQTRIDQAAAARKRKDTRS